jgi:hypothetical protein
MSTPKSTTCGAILATALAFNLTTVGSCAAAETDPIASVSARVGAAWLVDSMWRTLSDSRVGVSAEVVAHFALTRALPVGLGYVSADYGDTVYEDLEVELDRRGLRLDAQWRHPLAEVMAVYGRGGVGLDFWSFELKAYGEPTVKDEAMRPALFGAAGVEAWVLRSPNEPLALGLTLEAGWEQAFGWEVEDGGTSLGTLDASGPSLRFGVTGRF